MLSATWSKASSAFASGSIAAGPRGRSATVSFSSASARRVDTSRSKSLRLRGSLAGRRPKSAAIASICVARTESPSASIRARTSNACSAAALSPVAICASARSSRRLRRAAGSACVSNHACSCA
jgi:hypothetical protein